MSGVKPRIILIALAGILLPVLALTNLPLAAQNDSYPLKNCLIGAFSTEEDFMMMDGRPYDGNPYISDGDLLSIDGQLCARNIDFVGPFDVTVDVGLDAVDILSFEESIVAFSTELDSPHGNFTAGDLILTNGAVIPFAALSAPYKENYNTMDIGGLDGIQFFGNDRDLLAFAAEARKITFTEGGWEANTVKDLLEKSRVDLWFSIEGTWHQFSELPAPDTDLNKTPPILDGDVLSASAMKVVYSQADLLSAIAPSGIPSDGVDFGLDAIAAPRNMDKSSLVVFSTEILFQSESGFTDGDVLKIGGTVVFPHQYLIKSFSPNADFLGVDALWLPFEGPPPVPNIQTMCGDGRVVADFEGGLAPQGSTNAVYTGLYRSPNNPQLRQPCGAFVPVDGFLPDSGVTQFRIAYRQVNDPVPAVGSAPGIQVAWRLSAREYWPPGPCKFGSPSAPEPYSLKTDSGGWMDAIKFLEAKNGFDIDGDGVSFTNNCANSGLRLAVWDTRNLPDDHYVVWLEWKDSSGMHREQVDHHLQLDNTLPSVPLPPVGLQAKLPDGSTSVPACGKAPKGSSKFQVFGQFFDAYYMSFQLWISGGNSASADFGTHYYYDPDDGTLNLKNTNATGTNPVNTTVHLRDIDLVQGLGEPNFIDCCYVLTLRVRDAAIRHSFNQINANDISGSFYVDRFITFAAAP